LMLISASSRLLAAAPYRAASVHLLKKELPS
jgi:hypothetical protein